MNILGLVVILSTIVAISFYFLHKLATTSKFQIIGELITHVKTNEKIVALTYDDGPNPPYTNQLLSVLEKLQAKATFFVVGKNVEKHPEVVKLILSKGHELGNHSYSHLPMILKTPSFIKSDIDRTDKLIRQLGVQQKIHFRAPFGIKRFILPFMLDKMNKKNILWNLDPQDYAASNSKEIEDYVLEHIKPGSIILLHDGSQDGDENTSKTITATENLIEKLRQQGYQLKTVSELLMLR
ncbi:MAG: polysaccharide deacetylase family protein [Nostocaceae cyanobacterium]|nr:polysaccharide deacetylase family protein [Nostocaceae cyanobacterium]